MTVLENCFKLLLIKHDDVRWSAGAAAGICEAEGGQVQFQSAGRRVNHSESITLVRGIGAA